MAHRTHAPAHAPRAEAPQCAVQGTLHTVLDSSGHQFGSAIQTPDGPTFVAPAEMHGLAVRPPFRVGGDETSQRVATTMGAALSSVLRVV